MLMAATEHRQITSFMTYDESSKIAAELNSWKFSGTPLSRTNILPLLPFVCVCVQVRLPADVL